MYTFLWFTLYHTRVGLLYINKIATARAIQKQHNSCHPPKMLNVCDDQKQQSGVRVIRVLSERYETSRHIQLLYIFLRKNTKNIIFLYSIYTQLLPLGAFSFFNLWLLSTRCSFLSISSALLSFTIPTITIPLSIIIISFSVVVVISARPSFSITTP